MEKIGGKLGFGFLNAVTGWSALFFEPSREKGLVNGWGRGIFFTVTNTAGGILHMATFPLPFDIPLPKGGVDFSRPTEKTAIPENTEPVQNEKPAAA